ncbi:MAG: hypothetical protein J5616_06940, partial [Bacteroidaceae bacterium]|nr:hypothetical protein [Bacteroidaceae bacterium]
LAIRTGGRNPPPYHFFLIGRFIRFIISPLPLGAASGQTFRLKNLRIFWVQSYSFFSVLPTKENNFF